MSHSQTEEARAISPTPFLRHARTIRDYVGYIRMETCVRCGGWGCPTDEHLLTRSAAMGPRQVKPLSLAQVDGWIQTSLLIISQKTAI